MRVHLEHFPRTWGGAAKKATAVHNLVQDNIDLLREAQPKTVRRYRDRLHTIHNLHRLSNEDPNYHGYMIREYNKEGPLIGLASVAINQAIWHPGLEQTFEGSDVSYWLIKDRRFTEHVDVAEALINLSGAHILEALEDPTPREIPPEEIQTEDLELSTADRVIMNRVFATVPTAHTELSPGFGHRNTLPAVGDPAIFSLPPDHTGPDHLEIARGGQVSQLHYGEFPLSIPR